MKFHSIEVTNLNSLYGTHEIDFETDVRNAPLFLIVGQTGAGKSTILDGISLALFGKTPRLEQQRGASETDVGHIMSVGTAKATAKLAFSVRDADGTRDRYLAEWSCRRAHDDPDGTVQRPERSLSKWVGGEWKLIVSDSRNKEFEGPFAKALRGLTVEDFRRTILLAQGDFAALLHASDDEKAAILERLTDTEVYQEIGARAAGRRREAERAYFGLKKTLEQTEVLEPEARLELESLFEDVEIFAREVARLLDEKETAIEVEKRRSALVDAVEKAEKSLEATVTSYSELQPKIERLELDKKYRPVEASFRGLVANEEAREDAEKQVEAARKSLEAITRSFEEATEARDAAAERLEKLEADWKALEPRLEAASRLEVELDAARKELEKAQKARSAAADEKDAREVTVAEVKKEVAEASQSLEAAVDARGKLPAGEELEGLGARIRAHLERAVAPAFEQLDEMKPDDEDDASVNVSALRARRTRAKNALLEVAPGLDQLDAFGDKLSREIAEKREQRDALIEATYAMDTLKQREQERDEVSDQIERLDSEITVAKAELNQSKERVSETKERLDELRRGKRLAEQVMALSELREQLEDGEPCPLCGSPVHPFCLSDELQAFDDEARRERDSFGAKLAQLEESFEELEREASLQKTALAAKLASRQHFSGSAVEVRQKLEQAKRKFATAAERGGFPPLEVWNLRQGDRLVNSVAAARSELQALEDSAEKLRVRRSDWERAVEDLRVAEQAESDIETRARLLKSARENLEARIDELEALIAILDIELDGEDRESVEEAAAAARDKLAAIEAAKAAVATRKEELAGAKAALEKAQEAAERASKSLAEQSEEEKARARAVKELESEIADALPEGRPSELKEAHSKALSDAKKSLAAARKKAEEAKSRYDERAGKLSDREESLARAEVALENARAAWSEAAAELGVTRDETAKGLLDLEERGELEAAVEKARDARDRARGALESAEKAQKSFLDQHPVAVELGHLEAEREVLLKWRDASAQRLGALGERKEQDDRRRAGVEERQEELEQLRATYDRWSTIASLIGTGEGAAFRTFAQSLNLQGLVDRANARLEHLAPRYELTVARGEQGQPTLDFAVRDAFKAGHERPLTTLSGGETFLVSLALALALSDYRRIQLPVETLLLDEGFGTLDQDALHMAVDTLQRLHQDGTRQVGIISHVEALKEMIDARIVVEKEGNGRSRLRFEVGGVSVDASSDPQRAESTG